MLSTKRHFNIPVFIPEEGCRFQCVFCNQRQISGRETIPTAKDVITIVEQHLATQPVDAEKEIAFFGGNFTGLPIERQIQLLEAAYDFYKKGRIQSIRLSTRPDFIDTENLALLKQYPVKTIELGVQSFSDHVLQKSGRGHTAAQNREAALLVKEAGFELVLQMMTGLPSSSAEDEINTAHCIINLGATGTRIYPCLVIKGTALEKLFREEKYQPQKLWDAARLSAQLIRLFEKAEVKVLRVGLHPSEGLIQGSSLVAGPFHPAFRDIAETFLFNDKFRQIPLQNGQKQHLTIKVAPSSLAAAVGFKKYNKNQLLNHFGSVRFIPDNSLHAREFTYSID
ncbi:MAG: hypothetical protein PWP35_261 [Bacteroidales bacterium]|jgi:histone acetyltransferase (RNA polymerase elongator complex component)|nr:hypothetical protein [Bacteroidales bacterium]